MKLAYKRQRQLAAIMFTDIVGYTAIMHEDENFGATIRERHRQVFNTQTEAYNGRIIQYFGDGTLSIFNSAIEAVECAVAMQKEFQQAPAVPLRIGIHIGDIVHSDEEVFGDGVNIAARIESVCMEGGILVSGKVYDEIKNHPSIRTKSLGRFNFKNVSDQVELFAIIGEGIASPEDSRIDTIKLTGDQVKIKSILENVLTEQSTVKKGGRGINATAVAITGIVLLFVFSVIYQVKERGRSDRSNVVAQAVPTDLSIAVLPFTNLSANPDNEYLSDGLTEDILTILSKMEDVRVVSRTSVMQYKETKKSMREIASELNVSNILEGSVRSSGNKLRVNAQLIDAHNDAHIWAETYDKEMTELLEVQGQVARDIAAALKTELSAAVKNELEKRRLINLKAYDFYLKGRKHYRMYTDDDNEIAISNFKAALNEDKNYALAYAGLGDAYAQRVNRYGKPAEWIDSSIVASKKALAIDPELSEGYKSLGLAHHYRNDYEKALEAYQEAIRHDPDNDMAMANIGAIYKDRGDLVRAFRWINRTLATNPASPVTLLAMADVNHLLARDSANVEILKKGIHLNPEMLEFYSAKGFAALYDNRAKDAAAIAAKMIEIDPEHLKTNEYNGYFRIYSGQFKEAVPFFRKARTAEIEERGPDMVSLNEVMLSYLELKTGDERKARRQMNALLSRLLEEDKKIKIEMFGMWQAAAIAMLYAQLGEKDQSIDWIKKAIDRNMMDYRLLNDFPMFDVMKDDEAFQKILQDLADRVSEMRAQVEKLSV